MFMFHLAALYSNNAIRIIRWLQIGVSGIFLIWVRFETSLLNEGSLILLDSISRQHRDYFVER